MLQLGRGGYGGVRGGGVRRRPGLRGQRLAAPPSQGRTQIVLNFRLHQQLFKYLANVLVLLRRRLHEPVLPVHGHHRLRRRRVHLQNYTTLI